MSIFTRFCKGLTLPGNVKPINRYRPTSGGRRATAARPKIVAARRPRADRPARRRGRGLRVPAGLRRSLNPVRGDTPVDRSNSAVADCQLHLGTHHVAASRCCCWCCWCFGVAISRASLSNLCDAKRLFSLPATRHSASWLAEVLDAVTFLSCWMLWRPNLATAQHLSVSLFLLEAVNPSGEASANRA